MDKIINKSLLQRCILHTQNRSFARRLAKGSQGKENTLGNNFEFPKHKELLQEGYYNGDGGHETHFEDLASSPLNERFVRENQKYNGDAIEFQPDGTTVGLDINGGILQNYRKVTEKSVNEIHQDDFWRSMQNMKHDVSKYFNNVSENEKDMMNSTKNIVMRQRLNREISFTDDFRSKYLVNDYGNYEKYQKNSVSINYDEGFEETSVDKTYQNFLEMTKRLPTRDAEEMKQKDRENIDDMLTSQEISHQQFPDTYFNWKAEEKNAVTGEEIDEEMDFLEDPLTFEKGWHGRMSPFVKETIYREYYRGMTIKDLSLKYGILQQRAKAIVFQKHLYWQEVYPKLGESHMRLALEREAMYAQDFPFVEYGQDLDIMAEYEKGVKVEHITRSEYDTDPHYQVKEGVDQFMMNMRSRKEDRVPIKLHGRGPAAYLLQDLVCHRGKGAARVSQTFKEIALNYGSDREYLIKKKFIKRMNQGGIRYASLGNKHAS